MKKSSSVALIISIIVVLVAAAGVGVWYWFGQRQQSPAIVTPEDVVVTPQAEPIVYFSIWSWQAEHSTLAAWDLFLDDIKSWGANTIITDIPWMGVEKSEGVFDFSDYDEYLDHIVERDLNMILVLDAGMLFGADHREPNYQATPEWLFKKYPDAKSQDFDGGTYPLVSFTHQEANQAYQDYLTRATQYYRQRYDDRFIAANPNLNNQMETRYAQQGFTWQDYGPTAKAAFADYLRDEYGDISTLNARWQANFANFEQAPMPRIDYNQRGFDPDIDPRFIDLMQFRERSIDHALEGATDAIRDAGAQVYLHFGEVLTKIDAIFTSPLELLAQYADIIAVDLHHLTGDGEVSDPSIAGVMVSHAVANGATVIYEDSVEPIAEPEIGQRRDVIVEESIRWAMSNGSAGLGVANFLHQWDKDGTYTFQRRLEQTMAETKSFTRAPVAMLTSRWTPYTVHSSNDYFKDGTPYDPWQTNLQGMFKLLEDGGVPVAVLSDVAVANGMLDEYDTLVLPHQMVVPEPTLAKIRAWHEEGGNLLQDLRFAEFSLTGERDATKIEELFGVSVVSPGSETSASVTTAFDDLTAGEQITIGDADLQLNRTSGLLTTNAVSVSEGTTAYLQAGGGNLLAINPERNAAFFGFQPGLLYLHRPEASLQETLQNIVLFAIDQLE